MSRLLWAVAGQKASEVVRGFSITQLKVATVGDREFALRIHQFDPKLLPDSSLIEIIGYKQRYSYELEETVMLYAFTFPLTSQLSS